MPFLVDLKNVERMENVDVSSIFLFRSFRFLCTIFFHCESRKKKNKIKFQDMLQFYFSDMIFLPCTSAFYSVMSTAKFIRFLTGCRSRSCILLYKLTEERNTKMLFTIKFNSHSMVLGDSFRLINNT